jgi:hypothetical protein
MTTDRSATGPSTQAHGLTSTRIDGLDFIATRVFDAPRAVVTTLTNLIRFATAKDLDFVVGTGMEQGLIETWDRLEAHLAAS